MPTNLVGGSFPSPLDISSGVPAPLQLALSAPGPHDTLAQSVAPLDTRALSYLWNYNAALSDLVSKYALGCFAIMEGLTLTAISNLNLKVGSGKAVLDNVVEMPSDVTIALRDNDTAYIWLKRSGIPKDMYGTLTPPTDQAAVYLGSVTTLSGSITTIDISGVCFAYGGTVWRRTGDLFNPLDTPPSNAALLTQTKTGLYRWDGTKHICISNYDRGGFFPGKPGASSRILGIAITRTCSLLATAPGSISTAGVAANANTTFNLVKVSAGVSTTVGSITFSAGSTNGIFAVTPAVMFAPGDVMFIVGPNSPDSSLADIATTVVLAL